MAEIVNLRRARKLKARAAKAQQADANHTRHGVAKTLRNLAKARSQKDKGTIDAHKLDER